MNIIESLNWRYATKKFDNAKKVSESDLKDLLEAVNLTPTSVGMQLQNVVVVENKELREKLLPVSHGQPQVIDASHLLVLCSETNVDEARIDKYMKRVAEVRGVEVDSLEQFKAMAKMWTIDSQDAESLQAWMDKQVYIALGNLMTAAAIMKIDACPMEGFDAGQYDDILGLTEKGLKSVLVVPVGYRSSEDPYPQMKKVRKELSDFVIKL
jgi:nitroreductase